MFSVICTVRNRDLIKNQIQATYGNRIDSTYFLFTNISLHPATSTYKVQDLRKPLLRYLLRGRVSFRRPFLFGQVEFEQPEGWHD